MTKDLKHWGVKGMRWGVRKSIRGGNVKLHNSIRQKYGAEVADRRQAYRAHVARAKSIKKQIKEADIQNFNKASKTITQKEKEMHAKLDSLEKKKLSEINSSKSMGPIKKFLAKATVKFDISAKRDNILGQLEDKYYFNPDKAKTKARTEATKKVLQEYDKKYLEGSKQIDAKKQGFIKGMKDFMELDRKLSMELTESLLRTELDIEKKKS